jgi:hypothetical protein
LIPLSRTRSGAVLRQLGGVHPQHHVGIEVPRALDLVEQLGGDGVDGHRPALVRALGDHHLAVGLDLGDRIAEAQVAPQLGEAGEVAAVGLGAALDQVPRRHRAGQLVPFVPAPAVPPGGGAEDQRGVGDPPADDDVRPLAQRGGDAPAAHVGVGGDHPVEQRSRRAPGVEVDEPLRGRQLLQAREQVVAARMGHAQLEAPLAHRLAHRAGQARRIEGAGVHHHLHAAPGDGLQLRRDLPQEFAVGIDGGRLRIGQGREPGDHPRHGELGQIVADQHVHRLAVDRRGDGAGVVADGAGDGRDAQGPPAVRARRGAGC